MKLSENTLEVLKNFATINTGLIVKPGKILRTRSSNILAEARIDEEFDREFGIYDLNKTLGILSLNKGNTEIEVQQEGLAFAGVGQIRQRFSAVNLIAGYDKIDKNITVDWFVGFPFKQEVHAWILSAASVLGCPNIVFRNVDGNLHACAMDVKGVIVDDASVPVANGENVGNCHAVLKIENLKLLKGAYHVQISKSGMIQFKHNDKKVTYWIALEKKESKF